MKSKVGVSVDNLTGGHIQEVLDTLIMAAIEPIILHSNSFDLQVVHLLGSVTKNKKRKLSALPREEFISMLASYLMQTEGSAKMAILSDAKIERRFLYGYTSSFIKSLSPFSSLYSQYLEATGSEKIRLHKKLSVISSSVGMTIDGAYITTLRSGEFLAMLFKFRNSVVCNYHKFAIKHARALCNTLPGYEVDDACHSFLSAITKALDKYDSSKGALTSYLKWWMLNVQNSPNDFGHEYGIAYSIPRSHRKALALKDPTKVANYSVSLTSLDSDDTETNLLNTYSTGEGGLEDSIQEEEEYHSRLVLMKIADPSGLGRLVFDIPEVFSKKEKRKMILIMKQQKTVK